MDNTKAHQKLVDDILLATSQYGLGIFWTQINGVFRSFYGDRIVKAGLNGACDVTGILPNGRRCEIEVKTGSGKLSKDQQRYKDMIERHGGLYIEARDVDSVIRIIKSVLAG